ncbi:MAG: GTP-dependent dephospho-CoA kinase family protein [Candidatus Micrarchaeia archaeon]
MDFIIDERARSILKRPFGILTDDKKVLGYVKEAKGRVISVGDVCSYVLISNGIVPNIIVYDKRCMRKSAEDEIIKKIQSVCKAKHRVRNPAGMISGEAFELVKRVMKENMNACIEVDGEEDLIALPIIIYSNEDDVVVYGQPNEGIVVVIPTDERKNMARKLLEMKD